MTSLLELPTVRARVRRLSVVEHHRAFEAGAISENVELLRGLIVTKTPKSPPPEFVAQKLMLLLLALVPKVFQIRCERPLTLRDSEPEPDLSVVRGQPEDWLKGHPATAQLVIEVAATSTSVDETKAEIYAEGYRSKVTLAAADHLQCAALPGVAFPVADIFPRA